MEWTCPPGCSAPRTARVLDWHGTAKDDSPQTAVRDSRNAHCPSRRLCPGRCLGVDQNVYLPIVATRIHFAGWRCGCSRRVVSAQNIKPNGLGAADRWPHSCDCLRAVFFFVIARSWMTRRFPCVRESGGSPRLRRFRSEIYKAFVSYSRKCAVVADPAAQNTTCSASEATARQQKSL